MRIHPKISATIVSLALAAGVASCGLTNTPTSASTVAGTTASSKTSTTSSSSSKTTTSGSNGTTASAGAAVTEVLAANQKVHEADLTATAKTTIQLSGTTATVTGSGASANGSTVTINAAGTYKISGTLTDGQIIVNADAATVTLILDGASITSSKGPALIVTAADQATIVLADGSSNSLTDSTSALDESDDIPNAALASKADLTIGGNGSLTVTGNAADGIASADGLVVAGGNITIKAADDGLRGKDYVAIQGGELTIEAGGDGIKAYNETDADRGFIVVTGGKGTVTSGADGVQAITDLVITGGELSIKAADDGLKADGSLVVDGGNTTVTESYEGLEGAAVTIAGGTLSLTSSDDGLSGLGIVVSGGETSVNAEGDGIDVNNGTFDMSGGTLLVDGPTQGGNGALDVDGGATISAGTLVLVGSSGMATAPANSGQGWISSATNVQAGQKIEIKSGDQVLATHTAAKSAGSIIISAAGITNGSSYDVYVDGAKVATVTAGQHTGGMGPGGFGGKGKRP